MVDVSVFYFLFFFLGGGAGGGGIDSVCVHDIEYPSHILLVVTVQVYSLNKEDSG